MTVTIHPPEDQKAFARLALDLFMEAAARELLKARAPAEPRT